MVQGIGLRWQTAQKARELQLTGYVRNVTRGQVEIVAQGAEKQLEQLKTWLFAGPGEAKIDRIDEVSSQCYDDFEDFQIRY